MKHVFCENFEKTLLFYAPSLATINFDETEKTDWFHQDKIKIGRPLDRSLKLAVNEIHVYAETKLLIYFNTPFLYFR